jgi:hypothetical protein
MRRWKNRGERGEHGEAGRYVETRRLVEITPWVSRKSDQMMVGCRRDPMSAVIAVILHFRFLGLSAPIGTRAL